MNDKSKLSGFGYVLGGFFLFIGNFLLWSNEKYMANTRLKIEKLEKEIVVVDGEFKSENNGKYILTKGRVNFNDQYVTDSVFNVLEKTPVLERRVEMYQWKYDESRNLVKDWDVEVVKLDEGTQETNPLFKPYENNFEVAPSVSVGEFTLSRELLVTAKNEKIVELDDSVIVSEGYKLYGNFITNSDFANPEIGDIRISFLANNYSDVTVLGVQNDKNIDLFDTDGLQVYNIKDGDLSALEMVNPFSEEFGMVNKIMRYICFSLIIPGYILVLLPLKSVTVLLPGLNRVVNNTMPVIGMLVGLINYFLAFAVVWFKCNSIFSLGLFGIIILLLFGIIFILNLASSTDKTTKGKIVDELGVKNASAVSVELNPQFFPNANSSNYNQITVLTPMQQRIMERNKILAQRQSMTNQTGGVEQQNIGAQQNVQNNFSGQPNVNNFQQSNVNNIQQPNTNFSEQVVNTQTNNNGGQDNGGYFNNTNNF